MASANIAAELAALPLDYMIATPLIAAINAQSLAAKSTIDFINEIGLDGNDVRMVDFKYNRSVTDQYGQSSIQPSSMSAPLLSIVPIPFLRIKDMSIDFFFKISTNIVDESSKKKEKKVAVKGGWGPVKVSASASYSSETKSKSTVDKTAELKIVVNAVQDDMPEGLRTVLSIFNNLIKEPPSSSAQKSAGVEMLELEA